MEQMGLLSINKNNTHTHTQQSIMVKSHPCRRSLPFIQALVKIRYNKDRLAVLKKFPSFVIKDIIEILYNVISKNCKISPRHVNLLRKHQKSVTQLIDNAKRRKLNNNMVLYKQKGGFLGAILPILASVLGTLFA
jgi:ribosomal protein S18